MGHHSLTCNHGPHRKHRHDQVEETLGGGSKNRDIAARLRTQQHMYTPRMKHQTLTINPKPGWTLLQNHAPAHFT
eukprot:6293593-Prorocentrum_lima.AAC.1